VEVTVTIPDSLHKQVDSLACQQEKSYSALVVEALQDLVEAAGKSGQADMNGPQWLNLSDEEITNSLNEFAAEHDTSLDPGLDSAQKRALEDEWEWD